MADEDTPTPYSTLGTELKSLREQLRESVAEVSGAVEIEEKQLSSIEAGIHRPSEDILTLLLSHFGVEEDRADELWELAGYGEKDPSSYHTEERDDLKRTAAMMVILDPRVMYSDSIEVVSNKQGVILNFSQTAGPNTPPLIISRVGMSYDQAKAVMGVLHQVLYAQDNPVHVRRLQDGSSEANEKSIPS